MLMSSAQTGCHSPAGSDRSARFSPAQRSRHRARPASANDNRLGLYAYVGNDPVNKTDPSGKFMLPPDNMDPTRDWATRQGRQMLGPDGRPNASGQTPGTQLRGATKDFLKNYKDMIEADTIGADKFFHCKANCEASARGQIGEATASALSDIREATDSIRKGDSREAIEADQRANRQGREAGEAIRRASPNSSQQDRSNMCQAACGSLMPKSMKDELEND